MINTREPTVAGMFYPADAQELRREVLSFLAAAKVDRVEAPKAIVAPHAGYVYSGPVAGSAYAQLATRAGGISRVVLLGPSHHIPFSGLAYSSAETFLTPLGPVPVDRRQPPPVGPPCVLLVCVRGTFVRVFFLSCQTS